MMNKTKKKNVYVKYAVIMCISGALGGILGGVMEMGQVHGVLTGIQEGMQFFLNSVRTWMLPLMAICGVIALVLCEQYMGRLKRAGEARLPSVRPRRPDQRLHHFRQRYRFRLRSMSYMHVPLRCHFLLFRVWYHRSDGKLPLSWSDLLMKYPVS